MSSDDPATATSQVDAPSTESAGDQSTDDATETSNPPESAPSDVPDLVGLSLTEARGLLAEAGITDVAEPVDLPQLGDPGIILSQVPRPGSSIAGTVTLTVSAPLPDMPDYIGRSLDDPMVELEEWGIDVEVVEVVTRDRPPGEVLETLPMAGARIGSQVNLTVSVEPTTIELTGPQAPIVEIDARSRNRTAPESGDVEIAGESYSDALLAVSDQWGDAEEWVHWEYNLSKDWSTFEAIAGTGDFSESFKRATFQVILDGEIAWEQELGLGEAVPISIDVTDVLRLRLRISPLHDGRGTFAWANPIILGPAE